MSVVFESDGDLLRFGLSISGIPFFEVNGQEFWFYNDADYRELASLLAATSGRPTVPLEDYGRAWNEGHRPPTPGRNSGDRP